MLCTYVDAIVDQIMDIRQEFLNAKTDEDKQTFINVGLKTVKLTHTLFLHQYIHINQLLY